MKNNIKSTKIFYIIPVLALCFLLIFSFLNTTISYAETVEGKCESNVTLQQTEEPEPSPDPDPSPGDNTNNNSAKSTKTIDNNYINIILILLLLLISAGSLFISTQNTTYLTNSIKSYFSKSNTKIKQE